jgi:YHS domain-containing protein
VAILARIIQFVLWLILATWLGRKLLGWLFGKPDQTPHTVPAREARKLHRDPWCGTFVSPEISFSLEHAGQVHHFCSKDCRERYRVAQRSGEHARASA